MYWAASYLIKRAASEKVLARLLEREVPSGSLGRIQRASDLLFRRALKSEGFRRHRSEPPGRFTLGSRTAEVGFPEVGEYLGSPAYSLPTSRPYSKEVHEAIHRALKRYANAGPLQFNLGEYM